MSGVGATSFSEGSAGSGGGALPLGTGPAETVQAIPVETLTIRVRHQTGEEVYFKVKKTTRMEKVFRTYATRMGVPARSLSFLLDGRRLNNDDTSVALGLEDQDQIDCVPDQAFDAHTKPWRPPSSCTCLSPDYETVKEELKNAKVDLEKAQTKLERRTLTMIVTSLVMVPLAMWVAAAAAVAAAGGG